MRHHLLVLLIATSLPGISAEVFSRAEILSGAKPSDPKNRGNMLFDSFRQTHEWEGNGGIRVRIWEAPGMWPGRFPVLVQIWSAAGTLVDAAEVELPAARPTKAWAFTQMGSHMVINLECEHRFHRETAIYAFRVGMDDHWVSGGPTLPMAAVEASGRLLADLVAANQKAAEQVVPPNLSATPNLKPESPVRGSED
jgi:hypothetical protein